MLIFYGDLEIPKVLDLELKNLYLWKENLIFIEFYFYAFHHHVRWFEQIVGLSWLEGSHI